MLERLRHSDGLGAIYPPMMYSVMALDVLGYAKDDPLRVEALRQFNNLMVDDGDRFFFQPCFSPVWDTAIGAYAMGQADPAHPACAARRTGCCPRKSAARAIGREAAQHRALRLGVRVLERVLSRHRRHRHGAAGVERDQGTDPAAQRAACGARSTGCWPCNRRTAAGRLSTPTTTGNFCARCRLPIITRCSIPPARTSPGGCSRRWRHTAWTAGIGRCGAAWSGW